MSFELSLAILLKLISLVSLTVRLHYRDTVCYGVEIVGFEGKEGLLAIVGTIIFVTGQNVEIVFQATALRLRTA